MSMADNQKLGDRKTGYRIIEGRVQVFCSRYVDIVIDNYYTLWKSFEYIKEKSYIYDDETMAKKNMLENAMMVVIVFSSMAIESYINDYAAGCLGDNEFYDSFAKLSVLDKLRLIVQFIYRQEFVKDQPVFTYVKRLIADRNMLVHNKSESLHKYAARKGIQLPETQEDIQRIFGSIEKAVYDKPSYFDKESINGEISRADNAIKALHGLVNFIDSNDPSERAYSRLLGAVFYKNDTDEFKRKKLEVFRKFQIPTHKL